MNEQFPDLQNKTALITGASGAIGAATVRLFGACGTFCWIHYHQNREGAVKLLDSIREVGGDGLLLQADLRDKNEMASLVEEIRGETPLDILVNNSGITRDALIQDMKNSEFHEVLDVNLVAPFLLIRDLGKMMTRGAGKIINVSSVASFRGGVGQGNYAASKAGLEALTRIAAVEMGPVGVNVNSVAPGITQSNMTAPLMEKFDRQLRRRLPLRRFAEPEDVARVVLFLASSMADYITGQTIAVDGGLTLSCM